MFSLKYWQRELKKQGQKETILYVPIEYFQFSYIFGVLYVESFFFFTTTKVTSSILQIN